MDLLKLQKRALEIREKYRKLEIIKEGKEWSNEKLIRGFLTDVQDLLKLVENKEDLEKISHELSDCLWSVLVLAKRFDIDIEQSFLKNMDQLEEKIDKELTLPGWNVTKK